LLQQRLKHPRAMVLIQSINQSKILTEPGTGLGGDDPSTATGGSNEKWFSRPRRKPSIWVKGYSVGSKLSDVLLDAFDNRSRVCG